MEIKDLFCYGLVNNHSLLLHIFTWRIFLYRVISSISKDLLIVCIIVFITPDHFIVKHQLVIFISYLFSIALLNYGNWLLNLCCLSIYKLIAILFFSLPHREHWVFVLIIIENYLVIHLLESKLLYIYSSLLICFYLLFRVLILWFCHL